MPRLRDLAERLGSPYLLQHAHNPVDWWTWGPDALAEAQRLERPIFLSVGYAACHWCHVMAHESFEDDAIAQLLNARFVSIKVDREERPDVDALYMAATQLVTGHGGWPMSVFLLPDGTPFYAGTYFPPVDRPGQVGFTRLLHALGDAWAHQRDAVVQQARELTESLAREVAYVDHLAPLDTRLDLAAVRAELRRDLTARCDADGGFGGAPKFPRASFVTALVDDPDPEAWACATRTLDAMSRRGLYDHVGGGFARYSVDAQWHVPHFEKMLSDQALLARAYLRADAAAGGSTPWARVALETLAFVERDLRVPDGYAASLDADAGGREGSHVTWSVAEVTATLDAAGLGELAPRALARWRIEEPGQFEGHSIPRLGDGEPFETPGDLLGVLDALRAQRARRPQPARDDKVVLEWNAMLAAAFLASGDAAFVASGLELVASLALTHRGEDRWFRTATRDVLATAGDVAWLIDATLDAFEATGDDQWLDAASDLTGYLLDHHWDGPRPTPHDPDVGGGLFTQCDLVTDLPLRPKELFDGAVPAAHAVATRAIARLAMVRADFGHLVVAHRLVDLAASLLATHPSAAPDLVEAAGYALAGVEIVIPGDENDLSRHVRSRAMPRTVLVTGSGDSPLLVGRRPGLAYVCRQGACRLPVARVADLEHEWREALL